MFQDRYNVLLLVFKHWQILLGLIAILAIVALSYLRPKPTSLGYKYSSRASIMTYPERELFNMLVELIDGECWVFPQIHLDAIFDYKTFNGEKSFGALRHINEKSVDFLICEKMTQKPLVAIELDDRSHERPGRAERDRVVNEIFMNASLPLLRISSKDAVNKSFVNQKLRAMLKPEIKEMV